MVPVVPLSCCSSSWVLRAIRAEKSVGSAIASSRALVCSDWVWPWVAAIASMQVRADVVEDVLRGQRPAAGLAVRAQAERLGVLRVELAHQPRPQRPGRAHLGDLHEEVHADRPEEGQPRRELVDRHAGGEAGADVLDAVGQRVRELEVGRRSGLLDVVAGDRDRVEARHLRGGVAEDVGDDPHARRRRVDVGVADHELLEDVVLDRPRELLRLHPLLLGRGDVEREHRQHGAVHRHRHRHLVERDAVEERAGVVDRVDRHARPCRRRRAPAGGRSRSRGGWPGRRRRSGPSGRPRGCGGRTRWTPRRWRSRRTAGSSTAGSCTSSGRARAGTGSGPGRCRARRGPSRSSGPYDGLISMPSGDIHGSRRSKLVASGSALGTLMPASPSSGSGSRGRRRPSRRSRRPQSRGLAGDDHPARRRRRAASAAASAPHSSYAASVPARQTTGWPSYAATVVGVPSGRRRRRRCRRRRAGWSRTSPGRCAAATVPSVARKTWCGGRLVAQRLEAGAVAADRRPGRRRLALGQRLAEVRELGEPGDRPLARGDLGLALARPSRRSRSSEVGAVVEPAEDLPRRRGRGRR